MGVTIVGDVNLPDHSVAITGIDFVIRITRIFGIGVITDFGGA